MLSTVLEETLDRVPIELRDPELDGELGRYFDALPGLAAAIVQARLESERLTVKGLELIVAQALDLVDRCAETEGYERTGVILMGMAAGAAGWAGRSARG